MTAPDTYLRTDTGLVRVKPPLKATGAGGPIVAIAPLVLEGDGHESMLAQINAWIKGRLARICPENGFTFTPLAVEEERKAFKPNGRFPFLVMVRDEITVDDEENDTDIVTIPYSIGYFDLWNDETTDKEEITYHFRNVIPDIIMALRAGEEEGQFCGGLARETHIERMGDGVMKDNNVTCYTAGVRFTVKAIINSLNYYTRG